MRQHTQLALKLGAEFMEPLFIPLGGIEEDKEGGESGRNG
jgi:hypothetical protein